VCLEHEQIGNMSGSGRGWSTMFVLEVVLDPGELGKALEVDFFDGG